LRAMFDTSLGVAAFLRTAVRAISANPRPAIRRHRRVETNFSAHVSSPENPGSDGVVVNASATGFAVRSGIEATVGHRVAVELAGMGRAEGEIVRLTRDGFAMKFDTPPSLSGDIRLFIERLAHSF
jgi:hypothetical protein